jgi:hypothetical protein
MVPLARPKQLEKASGPDLMADWVLNDSRRLRLDTSPIPVLCGCIPLLFLKSYSVRREKSKSWCS